MISFETTTCPDSRRQAYRLRYEVYVNEFGYPFEAPQQEIQDAMDSRAILFMLKRDGHLIGTARANALSTIEDQTVLDRYGIHKGRYQALDSVGIASRFILDRDSRGGPYFCRFLQDIYVWGLHHGFRTTYLDASPQLAPMYQRLGWAQCAPTYQDHALGVRIPMFLDMLDADHLKSIRSPLRKSLAQALEAGCAV